MGNFFSLIVGEYLKPKVNKSCSKTPMIKKDEALMELYKKREAFDLEILRVEESLSERQTTMNQEIDMSEDAILESYGYMMVKEIRGWTQVDSSFFRTREDLDKEDCSESSDEEDK